MEKYLRQTSHYSNSSVKMLIIKNRSIWTYTIYGNGGDADTTSDITISLLLEHYWKDMV